MSVHLMSGQIRSDMVIPLVIQVMYNNNIFRISLDILNWNVIATMKSCRLINVLDNKIGKSFILQINIRLKAYELCGIIKNL